MTPELRDSVIAIAKHMWRGAIWVKGPKGPRSVKRPLMVSDIESHVNGGPAIGLAPIVPGTSETRAALLDLDSHRGESTWAEMVEAGLRVMAALRAAGMSPFAFRSSGGKGIHIYLLWETEQDAFSVREMLRTALASAGFKYGTKGVKAGEAEWFPKNDSVPADGYGSMWLLPLAGESLPLSEDTLEVLGYDYAEERKSWPISAAVPVIEKPVIERPASADIPADLAELRSALAALPQETEPLDYEKWRNVIFAVHHATGGSDEGLALAHEFSARSAKYDPDFLDKRVWPSIRSDRTDVLVTARSLYALAREYGWQENVLDDFEVLESGADGPAVGGSDSAERGAQIEAQPSVPTRFKFTHASEFRKRPAPQWIVRNLLPRSELAVVYGASGAGKSFLALDIAASVQRGVPWRNLKVKQGEVAYIAAEGAGGFRNRLEAYCRHHQVEDLGLQVLDAAPNILNADQVKQLAAAMRAVGPITMAVVDTLAQVTPGADENSAEDMGKLVSACKALHRLTGATIVLVHHAGKDPTRGMRGSSAVQAACDAVLEVSREGEQRLATVAKLKDGQDGAQYPFQLGVIPIDFDEDGDVIDSCVVEHLQGVEKKVRVPKGANNEALIEAYDRIRSLGTEEYYPPSNVIDECCNRDREMGGSPRRFNYQRALESLIRVGVFEEREDGKIRKAVN